MISDADIEKMKRVFATKDDLKDFSKRFDGVDKRLNDLSKDLRNTTEELIELITGGFNSYEERFGRLESKVFKAN